MAEKRTFSTRPHGCNSIWSSTRPRRDKVFSSERRTKQKISPMLHCIERKRWKISRTCGIAIFPSFDGGEKRKYRKRRKQLLAQVLYCISLPVLPTPGNDHLSEKEEAKRENIASVKKREGGKVAVHALSQEINGCRLR